MPEKHLYEGTENLQCAPLGHLDSLQWKYKIGMRLILLLTVWEKGHLLNCPFYKFQGLRERKRRNLSEMENIAIKKVVISVISKDFAPNTKAEILLSFKEFWS